MTARELLGDLYRHMEWADASIWAAVLASKPARSDAVLHERLHHIHLVQHAFFSIWHGEPVDRNAGCGLSTPELAAWARPFYPQARRYLEELSDEELSGVVTLPWSRQMTKQLGFEPATTTLGETLTQVYAHTGHHRGQVAIRLRELGVEPPLVDYIAWIWHGRPEPAWP